MARTRKPANRDLPPNLYVRNNGYYCYRDPRTGKEYGLGKEKRMAINEAISANRQIFDAPVSLTDRINEVKTLSMTEWIEQFTKKLQQRGLRPNTLRDYRVRLKAINNTFGEKEIKKVTTKEIAEFLNSYTEQGKTATAKLTRGILIDHFQWSNRRGTFRQ